MICINLKCIPKKNKIRCVNKIKKGLDDGDSILKGDYVYLEIGWERYKNFYLVNILPSYFSAVQKQKPP